MSKIKWIVLMGISCVIILGTSPTVIAEVGFGKPGQPVELVVGYQPYYTESWSGVVINGQKLWKKHLPSGSSVEFEIGLQGSVIVGKLLGEKNHIGYMGDMPAIVSSKYRARVGPEPATHEQCGRPGLTLASSVVVLRLSRA